MPGPTDLSMLWEAADPATTLRTRFGFTDVDHAVSWLADVVAEGWGLRVDHCERVVLSANCVLGCLDVDGRSVVAKCAADPARHARLAAVDDLVAWLADEGVPVAVPIVARDGRRRVERGRFSVGLAPRVAGDLLDVDDPAQVAAAGGTLAALHTTLAAYPRVFGTGPPTPGRQLVHGDFRAANILCRDGRITAVLDFDETGDGPAVADLAQAAVLLGTRYHDWAPTSPDVRAGFVAAYDDVRPLTAADHADLERGIAAVAGRFGWT